MFSKIISGIVIAAASFLAAAPAQATVVTFNWSAISTTKNTTYGVKVGDLISGSLSYDLRTVKAGSGFDIGFYAYQNWSGITSTLQYGSYTETLNLGATVVDNWLSADSLTFSGTSNKLGDFSLDFTGSINSLYLPSKIDLTKYSSETFSLGNLTLGLINTPAPTTPPVVVTPTEPARDVPEPASLALFGIGLAGLAIMRRRRML